MKLEDGTKVKKKSMIILSIIAIILVALPYITDNVGKTKEYSLAAASPGGTYFAMSGGLSSLFNEGIEGSNLSVQTTAGSAENIRLLQSKEVDFALANGSEIYWGYNGEGFFEDQESKDMRIVTFAWTNVYHGLSLKDKTIVSLEDYMDKDVGVGPRGSAAEIFHQMFFQEAGIWEEINPVYLPPEDQVSSIKDGNLDTFGYFSGLPLSSVVDLTSIKEVSFINVYSLGEDFNFDGKYPFYIKAVIPAGTYKGQEEVVNTYANLTYIIAHKDVDEDIIYKFLKKLYSPEGLNYMKDVHSRAVEFNVDTIDKMVDKLGVPMHEGAVRFMEEN